MNMDDNEAKQRIHVWANRISNDGLIEYEEDDSVIKEIDQNDFSHLVFITWKSGGLPILANPNFVDMDTIELPIENVGVDENGRITSININTPSGPWDVPSEIGMLDQLEAATLHQCSSLPLEMKNLTHLQHLSLKNCNFGSEGSLPE